MTILEIIRDGFASMRGNGARPIGILPNECPAYIIRIPDGFGVAIPVDENMKVAETFNSCRFRTVNLSIESTPANYLVLISAFEEYRNEFASFCADLVDPGVNGTNRQELLSSPLKWWKKWKELVGNSMKERAIYSIIAEMYVLEHKLSEGKTAEWTATRMGSRDIECTDESGEVKSTCKRYGKEVSISGQFQLDHKKPLYLYFVRMEESMEGVSVNDMKARLINAGYNAGQLERELQQQGLEPAASIRDKKFKILEKRKYKVDENFPQITGSVFKGDRIPAGIKHIVYTVDLEAVPEISW